MIQACQRQEKINGFLDKLHKNNSLRMVGQPPEYSVEKGKYLNSLGKQ